MHCQYIVALCGSLQDAWHDGMFGRCGGHALGTDMFMRWGLTKGIGEVCQPVQPGFQHWDSTLQHFKVPQMAFLGVPLVVLLPTVATPELPAVG